MTATADHRRHEPFVLAMGAASGIVCFALFQSAYWLTAWFSRLLPTLGDLSESDRSLLQRSGPSKWLGAAFVVLIALAVTYAWDQIRIRYRLNALNYWTMIGLSLAVCLLATLLSSRFF